MESQIVSAIDIAADPHQDRALKSQAVDFLNAVRVNAKASCTVALTLFLDQNPDGSRKHNHQVRVFALQLLDDFLDASVEPLDPGSFQPLEQAFVLYIQSEYVQGQAEANAPYIRNKFSHTLALLFLRTYPEQWSNFFPTIYSLLRPAPAASDASGSNGAGMPPINGHVSILFLRLLVEISGEVHDNTLKSARSWSDERHARDGRVRTAIRENEAQNMNTAVLTIVSEAEERAAALKGDPSRSREHAGLEEVVELGMKAFAGYCPWVDINLTVNENTVPLIFRLLSEASSPIRQTTAYALSKIVTRGLKEPTDKLQLIRVLSLGEVLEALEEKSRKGRAAANGSSAPDEAEEAFRESLGKLACGLGGELLELIGNENFAQGGRDIAEQLLMQLLPVAIQFLADEYDDTSSTIFPLFTSVFGNYKKAKKLNPQNHLTDAKRSFMTATLKVIVDKMKWDQDAAADEDEYDDMDEDDRGAFEKMRSDLRSLVDSILTIDEQLVTEAVQAVAMSTLSTYEAGRASSPSGGISWQDAELAVYLVFLFGEFRGKGKMNFVQMPPDIAADKLKRKAVDLESCPLTAHGELMHTLVRSNIASYPHIAVRSQFFEVVGRYLDFFKVRRSCVIPVLEALVDERGMHQPKKNRRGRVFYVFHRFIKEIRSGLTETLIPSLLGSIQDLLVLDIEMPSPDNDGQSSSSAGSSPTPDQDANSILEDAVKTPGLFDNQLYLFETTGTLISSLTGPNESEQVSLLQAVTNPLLQDLAHSLQTPMKDQKDVLPVFRTHHLIQTLASVAKGFPDATTPSPGAPLPPRVEIFKQIAEAVLVSLETLRGFKIIRDATRFAFTRLIAVAGVSVAHYIPTLTSRLLAAKTEPSEVVELFSFLGLVFYRHLGDEVLDMLDQLIIPLTTKVSAVIAQPIDGTDARQAHEETKRAYVDFILVIMSGPLYTVFISPRNGPQFETLVGGIISLAADTSHPPTQRTAFSILTRFTTLFGSPEGTVITVKNRAKPTAQEELAAHHVPGYERVIYERLIPLAFDVPASAGFNIKDGQTIQVLGEIGVLLKATHTARGQEILDFFSNTFLPSKGWPAQTAIDFVTKLRDLDSKGFKKFFSDFVRGVNQSTAT